MFLYKLTIFLFVPRIMEFSKFNMLKNSKSFSKLENQDEVVNTWSDTSSAH